MGEIAVRQAILHAVVAAAFVEAVLWAWNVRRAESRLRFWLLALAFPLLILPLLLLGAPFRGTDWFAAGWALFASRRWNAVRVGGAGTDTIVFAGLALAGTLLFLRDGLSFVRAAVAEWRQPAGARAAASAELTAVVRGLASRSHVPPPEIAIFATDDDVLFVRGVGHPTLVLSTGVVARLAPNELRAAIAHEVAHVRFHDPLAGWALMAVRLVMFWNPAVQLVSRAIVQEMEHRADRAASDLCGAPSFATALGALAASRATPAEAEAPGARVGARATHDDGAVRAAGRGRIEMLAERLHRANIASRIDAVLSPAPALPFGRTRFGLVAATLASLLFFVV